MIPERAVDTVFWAIWAGTVIYAAWVGDVLAVVVLGAAAAWALKDGARLPWHP